MSGVNADACDRAALAALAAALAEARGGKDLRPPFVLLADVLLGLSGGRMAGHASAEALLVRGREDWLRRLRSAGRSESSLRAYRNAVDDLLAWGRSTGRVDALFAEHVVVEYLDGYRRRCSPAPATYHRRFLLLRRFMRWVAAREGIADPFAELDAPPRPRQEAAWLTPEEFARILAAADVPARRLAGMAQRDRLVLLALVTTGLRRAELVALDWGDLVLDGEAPSLLVRRGKGGKPRRQPLPGALAGELRALEAERRPSAADPVFIGLQGRRLQPTILAGIVRRSAQRAGIEKHVTAHTLRHTAATWLRQATGDARLVAEYLGHADLSTVSRYAHVASDELRAGAEVIAAQALPSPSPPSAEADRAEALALAA